MVLLHRCAPLATPAERCATFRHDARIPADVSFAVRSEKDRDYRVNRY